MTPIYNEGDFVILAKFSSILNNLTIGDDIVYLHMTYSNLIKRIVELPEDDNLIVKGINSLSISSSKLGPVPKSSVIGKVIYHIPRPF